MPRNASAACSAGDGSFGSSSSSSSDGASSNGDGDAADVITGRGGSGSGHAWDSDASQCDDEGLLPSDDTSGTMSDSDADADADGDGSKDPGLAGSVLPFLDTAGVTVHLSEFGLLWNTLHGWVTPAARDYVSGDSSCTDDDDAADAQPPTMAAVQQRAALASHLACALPFVVEALGIRVSCTDLSRQLHALVRRYRMPGPVPALAAAHWAMLTALMLAALAPARLPALRPAFARTSAPGSVLDALLKRLGSDTDRFFALLDLFEL